MICTPLSASIWYFSDARSAFTLYLESHGRRGHVSTHEPRMAGRARAAVPTGLLLRLRSRAAAKQTSKMKWPCRACPFGLHLETGGFCA